MKDIFVKLFIVMLLIIGLTITALAIIFIWTVMVMYSTINWMLNRDGFSHSKKPSVKFDRQAVFNEVDKSNIRMSTMTEDERNSLRWPVTRYGVPTSERFKDQ